MNSVFTNSTVVIIANDVNLSIFKPPWLIKTKIFQETELGGNIILSPIAVHIPTKNFEFAVFPNRIQLSINQLYSNAQSDISRVLGGIATTLPHTPYNGIGLNFNYLMAPEDENAFGAWNRKLFASEFVNNVQVPQETDARFGAYFSFNTLDAMLKIDIKPTRGQSRITEVHQSWHTGQEVMKLNFNFHNDISQENRSVEFMLTVLNKWEKAFALAQEIIEKISN